MKQDREPKSEPARKMSFFAPHGKRILQIIPMLESIGEI